MWGTHDGRLLMLLTSDCDARLPSPSHSTAIGSVLAFDFGVKRIGVAVGDASLRIAHPLATIEAPGREQSLARVDALVAEWQPVALVVGLPTHVDGSEHELTERARGFAREIERRCQLPVTLVDERFTTLAAAEALTAAGLNTRKQKPVRDQVAAQIILQAYFDQVAAAPDSGSNPAAADDTGPHGRERTSKPRGRPS
jgi:putative Holliday junction resolvase